MTMDLAAAFGKPLDPAFAARLQQVFSAPIQASDAAMLALADGRRAPVVNAVPRFVESDQYVSSFSFQWSNYETALHNNPATTEFSLADFTQKFGLDAAQVKGKLILDAGCGTGRLSDILAGWGAHVVGIDLSASVDIARHVLAPYDHAVVMQCDIGDLPFRPEAFDIVISSGVLHHTPDTRASAARLVPLVRPGGEFAIWVYDLRFQKRKDWIPLTSRLPHPAFNDWCTWIVEIARRERATNPLLEIFMRQFPFRANHATPEQSALTLFDGFTPTYHGVHSEAEVTGWFRDFGLTDIRTNVIPTSVRGRKPL